MRERNRIQNAVKEKEQSSSAQAVRENETEKENNPVPLTNGKGTASLEKLVLKKDCLIVSYIPLLLVIVNF